jgi:hypothetical protein
MFNNFYSFICASAIMKNFIPVFMITNVLLSFILPTILLILLGVATSSIRLQVIFVSIMPPIFFPSHAPLEKNVFKPETIMSKIMHHVAVLLTFGICSPPLAISIFTSICVNTFIWQLLIGRYIYIRKNIRQTIEITGQKQSNTNILSTCEHQNTEFSSSWETINLPVLESLCQGVWMAPQNTMWLAIDCSVFFFSIVVIDLSGDKTGWVFAALTLSIPTLCIPLLLRWCFSSSKAGLVSTSGEATIVEVLSVQKSPMDVAASHDNDSDDNGANDKL